MWSSVELTTEIVILDGGAGSVLVVKVQSDKKHKCRLSLSLSLIVSSQSPVSQSRRIPSLSVGSDDFIRWKLEI